MTAVTIGKFDGFHKGHQMLLGHLTGFRAKGLRPVVLRIDMPGPRILSAKEDQEILDHFGEIELRNLRFTDELKEMSPESFVRKILVQSLQASEIVVGTDFRFGYRREGDAELLRAYGRKFGFGVTAVEKLVIGEEVVSSSRIRSCLADGKIEAAEVLLGHSICFSGEVEHGKQLGRTLGFPTINLTPPSDKLLPAFGVYRSEVELDGKRYSGLTNIGLRPTVADEMGPSVETYVFDYSGNAYGKSVKVKLIRFQRPEMQFASLEELREQIQKDLHS